MSALPQIMVAPNGARLGRADHPALPITQAEVVDCARACFAAGAGGLHAHVRDDAGAHLLDGAAYRDLLRDLQRAVPDMALQITTEAAGIYEADHQMQVALDAGADMVSASVREILRAGPEAAREFYAACVAQGIAVQHILYDLADCDLLAQTLGAAELARPELQLIYVLGRYSTDGLSDPADLDGFVTWLGAQRITPDWALCAFGPTETACLTKAARHGGKCRVGFENSLYLSDGRIAADNAEKVADLKQALAAQG